MPTFKDLWQYRITPKQYDTWASKLKSKEYNDSLIQEMILLDNPGPAVEALIGLHDPLFRLLEPHFTNDVHTILVQIAKNNDGNNSLQALLKHFQDLLDIEFTPLQIIRMLRDAGDSKHLEAALDYVKQLNEQTLENLNISFPVLDQDEVVRILSYEEGKISLSLLIKHFKDLRQNGYDIKTLVNTASKPKASKDIVALCETQTTLFPSTSASSTDPFAEDALQHGDFYDAILKNSDLWPDINALLLDSPINSSQPMQTNDCQNMRSKSTLALSTLGAQEPKKDISAQYSKDRIESPASIKTKPNSFRPTPQTLLEIEANTLSANPSGFFNKKSSQQPQEGGWSAEKDIEFIENTWFSGPD